MKSKMIKTFKSTFGGISYFLFRDYTFNLIDTCRCKFHGDAYTKKISKKSTYIQNNIQVRKAIIFR